MTSTPEAVQSWIDSADANELRDLKRVITDRLKFIDRQIRFERAQALEARDALRAPWVAAIDQISQGLYVNHRETATHTKEEFTYSAFWEKLLNAHRGLPSHKYIDTAWKNAEKEGSTLRRMQDEWTARNTVELQALRQMSPRQRMQAILDSIVRIHADVLKMTPEHRRAYYFWQWQSGSFFDRTKPGFRPMTIDEWFEHDNAWFEVRHANINDALMALRRRGIR